MEAFYEKMREESDELNVQRNPNPIFPAHFHLNLEVLLLRKGGYTVRVGDRRQEVGSGSVVVIDSYEIHGYEDSVLKEARDSCVVIFPYRYLQKFNEWRKNFKIAEPIICDEALCEELMQIADTYLTGSEQIKGAAADLFLARLYERLRFSENKARDESSLVRQILSFIQENFQNDVSRKAIARELGYTEAHISRVFHRCIGKSISEYVNGLRLAYVERLRASGVKRTTLDLLYEAGFKSQQTFYRVQQQAKSK